MFPRNKEELDRIGNNLVRGFGRVGDKDFWSLIYLSTENVLFSWDHLIF